MALSEELRLADLRSREELPATITAVESVEYYDTDEIQVTYVYEDSGMEFEATDTYDVPPSADPSYDFVRLCEQEHVPLGDAHEELVDATVPVTWTGDEWTIRLEEDTGSERNWSSLTTAVFDAELSPALALAVLVAYPVVSPLVCVHLWARRGPARAAGVTLALLVGWLLAALLFGQILGIDPV